MGATANPPPSRRKRAAVFDGVREQTPEQRGEPRGGEEIEPAEIERENSLLLGGAPGAAIAHLRRRALAQRRRLAGVADGAAKLGGSNWVVMGPQALPNGQTQPWLPRVLAAGRVVGLALHPTDPLTIYLAAARGGVWKTTDGGASWVPKSDNEASLAMGAIALAPSAPDTIYAGTGEGNIYWYTAFNPLNVVNESYLGAGILKSIDGGDTWSLQGVAQLTGAACYRIAVHPVDPDIAFAATSRGLYVTRNGGTLWKLLAGGLPLIPYNTVIACTDVVIDSTNGDRMWTAFFGGGIYESDDGGTTWGAVNGNPPANAVPVSRVSLAIAPSSPNTVYAIVRAFATAGHHGIFRTTGGIGGLWRSITPTLVISPSGYTASPPPPGATNFTCFVEVDPFNPNLVYLASVYSYRLWFDPVAHDWFIEDIGLAIHADNHVIAADPHHPGTIYAGNDGGIYKSSDSGENWTDEINKRLNLMQFEFMDQHPAHDAIAFAGTQDNGTNQYRGSEVFYHAADGDGGAVAVDPFNPRNVVNEHYAISPERSTQAGKFQTFSSIKTGLSGGSLFYPPLMLDPTNSSNLAFGTATGIFIDDGQGTNGWATFIKLGGMVGFVSALGYVDSALIYAGTSSGEVYRAERRLGVWSATPIHDPRLAGRWIWDVAVSSGNPDEITVALGGFGGPHVWRGTVSVPGPAGSWTPVSGIAGHRLPDAPVNSLALDALNPGTMYAGTDVGVFVTRDDGRTWDDYRQGLPNTAVYDLKIHGPTRLLRAATHGRGMWEREIDAAVSPNRVIYVRDNVMHSGRGVAPSGAPAALEDDLHHVALGDPVFWWQCADIKVDAMEGSFPRFQLPVPGVDFVAYESQLVHRNPTRGQANNVYVQVHNRGILPDDVTVRAFFADATTDLPDLPPDFWTAFPNDPALGSDWTPVGDAAVIGVRPGIPEVVSWVWTPPFSAARHSCLLVVCDGAQDSILAANKGFHVATLVNQERRVGVKNVHVVGDAATLAAQATLASQVVFAPFYLGPGGAGDSLRIVRSGLRGWSVGLVLPHKTCDVTRVTAASRRPLSKRLARQLASCVPDMRPFEGTHVLRFEAGQLPVNVPLKGRARRPVAASIVLERDASAGRGTISVLHERDGVVLGGNTFVVPRRRWPRGGDKRA